MGLCLSESNRFRNDDIAGCDKCPLSKDCTSLVPSMGRYNMMVVAEMPFKDDDGILTGRSGNVVWRELEKHDFVRRDFHVTSFVKCKPDDPKTVTVKHLDKCRDWIEEELMEIKPFIVLGIGNMAVKFFREEESGIMALNGTTEWNERYGCYVHYIINPAQTYYGDNIVTFRESIKNFVKKIKILGFASV